jgi:hypothetical protein
MTRSGRLRRGVSLAVTYGGGDALLLERVLPLVDVVELSPDTMLVFANGEPRIEPASLAHVRAIGDDAKVVVHGISLSIGSADAWQDWYLRLLSDLFAEVDVRWHSEHLGYTHVDGDDLGTMLALPRTHEALELVAARVNDLQRSFAVPFLIENVAGVLRDPGGTYTMAGFLNELARATGCGLLLDVYNLECDAWNHGLDLEAFFAELDLGLVREVHVACGIEHRGLRLDVHSRATQSSTVALASRVIDEGDNLEAVTYEFLPQAVAALGHDAIAAELAGLSETLGP